jgi:Abortive infection alpha
VGSELIAPGLNMIGQEAGCRRVERVPAYLNNLNRLGLIWFSREPLDDPLRYQVVEAQPEVVEALKNARLSRTVRRSIHLTPFGEDFCATVLPEETPAT